MMCCLLSCRLFQTPGIFPNGLTGLPSDLFPVLRRLRFDVDGMPGGSVTILWRNLCVASDHSDPLLPGILSLSLFWSKLCLRDKGVEPVIISQVTGISLAEIEAL